MTVGHTVIHVQEGGVHCPHVPVIYSPTRERERERDIELTTILPQRTVHQKGLIYY